MKKPETLEGKVDSLWEVVHNHVLTQLTVLDIEVKFILVFVALLLALCGILIVKL